MLAANIPAKFQKPFAANAGSSNIRPIPIGSQQSIQPGAASLTDGFPPLNFQNVAAGGIPPFGQDMNGILNQITLWNQWHAAGGPVRFDATFASAIGGYPAGALVQSNTSHAIYESITDNNLADPNAGSTQWRINSCVWSTTATQAGGSANIQTITLSPSPISLAQLVGIPIDVISQGVNTGPVTLNPNGLGAIPVQQPGGIPLSAGALTTSAPYAVAYNGSAFIVLTGLNVYTDTGNSIGLTVDGSANAGSGGGLTLRGPSGGNKFLRVLGNVFQILNSAYNAAILQLNDTGAMTITGNLQVGGAITAVTPAFGSGNADSVPNLLDFPMSATTQGNARLPNGLLLQWGSGTTTTGNDTVAFPKSFTSGCLQCYASEAAATGWIVLGPPYTPTVLGAVAPTTGSFELICLRWNPAGGNWQLGTGVLYRYWAVGV